jgi:hypothetical protein
MRCPECRHSKSVKNGHARGKQRWICKGCGYQFVEDPQPVGAPRKGTAPHCSYCETGILHKRSTRGKRLFYQCRNPECRRFSTYELDGSGNLVRVMTRKGKPQTPQGLKEEVDRGVALAKVRVLEIDHCGRLVQVHPKVEEEPIVPKEIPKVRVYDLEELRKASGFYDIRPWVLPCDA